jgi:hypothetical protein
MTITGIAYNSDFSIASSITFTASGSQALPVTVNTDIHGNFTAHVSFASWSSDKIIASIVVVSD